MFTAVNASALESVFQFPHRRKRGRDPSLGGRGVSPALAVW